ncbi:MAG: flagellar basal body P-ring protein FlgI [Planctomycetota bacterium]
MENVSFLAVRRILCTLLCSLGLLTFSGCMDLKLFRFQNAEKDRDSDDENKDRHKETEFVGNYAAISGNNVIAIHGVGLVTGLNNTGEDPQPSIYRTQLEADMKKRNIPHYREQLQSMSTALVLLTAYLPADIQKGGTFDVEVRLPPNTEATSLAGGWLLEADMTEQANVQGQGTLKGKIFGKAAGPILVSIAKGENQEGVLKRGRILGGGIAFKERTLGLYLRSDFRSVRNTSRIADRIGSRFHHYDHGQKKSLAEAKDDQYVQLKVHPRYKDNYPRYMQVIRHVAFRENDVQRRDRMERLQDDLINPERAAKAAIQYESIGTESIIFLKKALNNPSPEVRFYSAEALAYLGDDTGAEELAKLAKDEPAFRVYCVAALSALDEAVCFQLLRDLMDEPSAETKYGAFRALWTLDKNDPYIRGKKLNDHFLLHVVDSKGDPMVHLTRHRRPEVVLFGSNQKFRAPMAVKAGRIGINSQAGSEFVTLTRFELGQPDQRKDVSPKVVDVIVAAAEMGASYPDIAEMLTQASQDYNIEGRLELDALPQAGRMYYRTVTSEDRESKKSTKVGRPSTNPNLFPVLNPLGEAPEESDEVEMPIEGPNSGAEPGTTTDTGAASLTDISKDSSKAPSQTDSEDLPPAQGKSKSKSKFSLFGRSKPKTPDAEAAPEKSAEAEPDDLGIMPSTRGKRKSKDDEPAAEKLPPVEGSSSKFEIE